MVVSLQGSWIDWVFYSEGSYGYLKDGLYGYLTEDGREIAPLCIQQGGSLFPGAGLRVSGRKIRRQTAGNYDEEELLDNAELFYDEGDKPYTREEILEAEYVTEYTVCGKQASVEAY